MSDEKRPYRKRQRAELEEQTRLRIAEAAVELHGTIGPAQTSISAIADRAGVRRSTVYRHFPDLESVFAACSSHWAMQNPVPDLERWAAVEDPGDRLALALAELYAFYGRTERMVDNVLRDEPTTPAMARPVAAFRAYFDAARETLARGRAPADDATVRAALGHALAFPTWRSLVREQGLGEREAVELMCALVAAADGVAVSR